MKRTFFAIGLVLLLAFAFAIPSLAGGWAVVTLDALPGKVVAGEPLEIGFMVRQHGITPLGGLAPTVHAKQLELGKTLMFEAKESGETGHYVATLTLPDVGKWQWSIEAFTGNQPMPELTVLAGLPVLEKTVASSASAAFQWPQWIVGLVGAAAVLAGLVVSIRQKVLWAIALILAGIVLSAGSIVSAAEQPQAESGASLPEEAASALGDSGLSQIELGHELFIAKGCMICHSDVETNKVREFGTDIGPNLTDFTASPDYLRLWLKDPMTVKSTAKMPSLGLSEAEIEALIAFINDT